MVGYQRDRWLVRVAGGALVSPLRQAAYRIAALADVESDFQLDYCPRCGEVMVGAGHECGEDYREEGGDG